MKKLSTKLKKIIVIALIIQIIIMPTISLASIETFWDGQTWTWLDSMVADGDNEILDSKNWNYSDYLITDAQIEEAKKYAPEDRHAFIESNAKEFNEALKSWNDGEHTLRESLYNANSHTMNQRSDEADEGPGKDADEDGYRGAKVKNPSIEEKEYGAGLDDVIDGAAGLVLFPAKLLPLILGKVMEGIMTVIAGNYGEDGMLTLYDILFNKVTLTDINFFDTSTGKGSSTVKEIRDNIAIWYTSLRNLAAIVIAIIAVYVGIRMALSVAAEEKAKYKQMLYDWLFGLALLFVLHYIIVFILEINNVLVNLLDNGAGNGKIDSKSFFDNGLTTISFVEGFGNSIAYLLITGITFMFLLTYIQRMVKLAFLVIIAPLVTATYSLDRMGDQKSQALNTWFKEFAYNVLIQPFQCVTYLAICSLAINLLSNSPTLADAAIAIFMLIFIFQAEKIVRHIFHFDQNASIPDAIGSAAVLTTAYGLFTKNKKKSGGSDDDEDDNNNSQANRRRVSTNRQAKNNSNNTVDPSGLNDSGQQWADYINNNESEDSDGGRSTSQSGGTSPQGNGGQPGGTQGPITRKQRISNALAAAANSRALQTLVKVNAKAAGIATGIGLGGATGGDIKTMVAATAGITSKTSEHAANYERNRKRHNLAKAYNTYRANNEGLTDEQIRQNVMDLANGDMEAKTNDQIALKEAIMEIKERYGKDGLSDKKTKSALSKDFDAIEGGKYGETTETARFYGEIKGKFNNTFKRKSSNRYNNNNNNGTT